MWGLAAEPARSRAVSWQRIAVAWLVSAWLTGVLLRAVDYAAAATAPGRQRQFRLVDSLVGMAAVATISFAIAGPVCRLGARRGWPVWIVGAVTLAINCVVAGFLTFVFLFVYALPPH